MGIKMNMFLFLIVMGHVAVFGKGQYEAEEPVEHAASK